MGVALAGMLAAGCVGEESGQLVTPSRTAARVGQDSVRIVEPRDGRFVPAGRAFLIRVEQIIRSGPVQGRGQVQIRGERSIWEDLGRPFPWSRQGAEFSTFAVVPSSGLYGLRIVVYAEERDPLFRTDPVEIVALGRTRPVASSSLAASRGALRGPPPR